jgi:bacterial leucyl aminopeptidase
MKRIAVILSILATLSRYTPVAAQDVAAQDNAWLVIDHEVAAVLQEKLGNDPAFAIEESTDTLAIARFPRNRLEELSKVIHGSLKRLGIGTVHKSKTDAAGVVYTRAPASIALPLPHTYQERQVPPPDIFRMELTEQALIARALDEVVPDNIVKTIEKLQTFGSRHFRSESGQKAARYVQSLWKQYGASIPNFSVRRFKHAWKQNSVIATIRGASRPSEIVVIGGHLDSINGAGDQSKAPGADDNASGIAVISEALRVIAALKIRPNRTLHFIAYAAEEDWLAGSEDIAKKYKKNGRNVVSALQIDMAGHRGSEKNIYLISDYTDPKLNGFLEKLMKEYNSSGEHQLTFGHTKCGYGCSDHASWSKEGVPAAMPFEADYLSMNDKIHSPDDTLENMDGAGANAANFAKLSLEYLIELSKPSDKAKPVRSKSNK